MEKTAVQESVSKDYPRMLKETADRQSCGDTRSVPGMIASLAGYQPALRVGHHSYHWPSGGDRPDQAESERVIYW
jgi:hypothetical protein